MRKVYNPWLNSDGWSCDQRGGMANSSQGAGVTREQGKFCDHTNKMYRYYVTQLFISVMQIENTSK